MTFFFKSEIPDVEGMVADNMEPEPVLEADNPEEESQGSSQTTNPHLNRMKNKQV